MVSRLGLRRLIIVLILYKRVLDSLALLSVTNKLAQRSTGHSEARD